MKREEVPEWDGLTDYRPPVFKEYEFNFKFGKTPNNDPKSESCQWIASLNYAREIAGNPSNDLWVERRKLSDAFQMGIEYAKRFLNCH